MAFSYLSLASAADWAVLEARLAADQSNPNISGVLVTRLRELNALSVLIEDDYLDRDFSEAYSAYYSTTFRRHSKHCTRLLFFATDISFVNNQNDVEDLSNRLEAAGFVGQVILRPISQAPIGQALLAAPPAPANHEAYLLVRSRHAAHVWGAELLVDGVPMTQQDSRVGACAQATIWVAARHFYQRHRGPWLSTVSITRAAIAQSEAHTNLMLPAGSESLTINNMVAALRHAGREPLIYGASAQGWGAVRPADIINRYIDSGIPVIVGLSFANQAVGHAIVATGQVFRQTPTAQLPPNPTRAEYLEAFYANDDQIGPNIRVALMQGSALSEAHYTIDQNANYLIIPLPGKVYLPAEKAETLAWSNLRSYVADWAAFKAKHQAKLGGSAALGDDFVSRVNSNEVVARTYLTYGWKYKKRGVRNRLSNPVRQVILNLEAPRFVYVTEFSTLNETTSRAQVDRRIHAHCVVDATAKNQGADSVLFMHAPGFCAWHSHDATGKFIRSIAPVADSTTYYPKARGDGDFANFRLSPF